MGSARNLALLDGVPGAFEFAPVAEVAERRTGPARSSPTWS